MTNPTVSSSESPVIQAPTRRRDGFALPMAIVVLSLLTMGLVAGFAMTSSEISTEMSQRAQARAYSVAQMGLETFLSRRKDNASGVTFCPHCWVVNSTPGSGNVLPNLDGLPTQRETVTVTFPNGTAIVRATPVYLDLVNGKGKYLITSTGFDNSSNAGGGGGRTVRASRTVGVFSTWNRSTMNVIGAWTSLTGIVKNGTGQISGIDQCGSGVNVAGMSVPQYNGVADMSIHGGFVPTGSPAYDTTKTFSAESSAVKIDWAGIKAGAIPADIVIGGGTFPSVATFAADTNYWPVIHVLNGPPGGSVFNLPNQGRGMLIVDGNLSISGSNQWYGVIMVGGVLTSNGNNVSEGATLSGLNALTGTPASASTADDAIANGTKSYVYDSCSVAKATSAMARYRLLANTWMDNLPGY